ncbi:MAG: molybdopterin molybdotransferase MoeA [Gammaproteobacteria bacterium]
MLDFCAMESTSVLSVHEARQHIAAALHAVNGSERLAVTQAFGRILAECVVAPFDSPRERNAAMDGYAFNHCDLDAANGFRLELAGTSWAGQPYAKTLQSGQCIRIFTGAVLPPGADSVIMQERVQCEGPYIDFPRGVKAFQHVRHAGEDVRRGEMLLAAPKRLTAIDLSLLASVGIHDVCVKRRLKIAYFSTGDELSAIGQPLQSGKLYDSNRYLLHGLLRGETHDVADLGLVPDDKALLKRHLSAAAPLYDVIISTGGASIGEADFIQEVLAEIGRVEFWKIAMKPGKPLAFGSIGDCRFFGLPGNPVAVLVTYHQIVAPALRLLAGADSEAPLRLKAICRDGLRKAPGRQEYQRGIFQAREQGGFEVTAANGQGSHQLAAAAAANCYIVLPADNGGVQPGEEVEIEPFINFNQ